MIWSRLRADWPLLLGRLAALAIVAWSPFPGGPRVPGMVLALLGAGWLWRHRGSVAGMRPVVRWLWVFALLWIPVLGSLATSFDRIGTLKILVVLVAYGLAGIGLLGVLADRASREWLARWLAIVVLVWIADSAVQYLAGRDLIGVPISDDGRVVGMFGDNLRQAIIVAALAPLLAAWAARWSWIAGFAAWGGALAVVLLSGVRGAWVVALIAGAAYLVGRRRAVRWRAVAISVLALALGAALLFRTPLVATKLAQTRLPDQWSYAEIDELLSYRLTIWRSALAMVADRPLTGVGAGAFDKAYPGYSRGANDPFLPGGAGFKLPVYHAHQMYVSVAAESGLVGLAALIAIVVLCARWYLRADPDRRAAALAPAAGLAGIAFPVNSQPILFTNWWLPILVLALCMMLAALEDGQGRRPDPGARAPP